MNEPIERTSDWILSKYVQDDVCQHGIYRLVSPRKLICTNCQTVIIDTQEMDGIADWMYALCRGA